MSRNKKGRWWYLAFKTLSLREILLPVIGFAISFVWIWNAAGQYLNLFKELQKPVVIQAEMSQNLSSDMRTSILSMQGVEALTPYSEQTAVMQWEDYSGEVSVYYVESDYMKWLSGQAVTAGVPFSEGMPYGIVSEKALEVICPGSHLKLLHEHRIPVYNYLPGKQEPRPLLLLQVFNSYAHLLRLEYGTILKIICNGRRTRRHAAAQFSVPGNSVVTVHLKQPLSLCICIICKYLYILYPYLLFACINPAF